MIPATVSSVRVQTVNVRSDCVGRFIIWFTDRVYEYADSAAEAIAVIVGYYGGEGKLPEIESSPEYQANTSIVDAKVIEVAVERGRRLKGKLG